MDFTNLLSFLCLFPVSLSVPAYILASSYLFMCILSLSMLAR